MKTFQLTQEETAMLCRELALLYHAGVTAGSGLYLLAEDADNRPLKQLLEDLALRTDEGTPLSEAMEHSGAFPSYVCSLLRVGEQTGRTEEALEALADYYEHQVQLTRRIRTALVYPVILMLVMLAVIVVLLTRVLPVFDDVYARLGGSMTGIAGSLLRVGQALNAAMPVLLVLLAAVLILLAVLVFSQTLRGRLLAAMQRSFGDKGLFRKVNTARFAHALSMGLYSGLPAEEALELASGLLAGQPAEQRCRACAADLAAGSTLAAALASHTLLPTPQCRLLELGVRSGSGEQTMRQIAAQLDEAAADSIESALGKIEPTLVLAASVLVGMILLSVMLPLLDIMSAIG